MIANKARKLKPSPTLALAAKAKELAEEGKNVISLAVGEPDWDTFEAVKSFAIDAIQSGYTKYAPPAGIPELRKMIAQKFSEQLGVDYTHQEVTVTTGAKFVIYSALQSLLDPEDEVIIPAPFWVSYPTMVEMSGGRAVLVPSDETSQFKLTAEHLERHLTAKTKVLILNSPSNPTGLMYTEDELKALAAVLRRWPNVVLLSDDIYNRLVFNEKALAPHMLHVAPDLKPRTIVVNGASKAYAMTGWRIGWALGPAEVINAMTRFQSQTVSCAASFSQKAASFALDNGENGIKSSLILLQERVGFAVQELNNLPDVKALKPDGAFYIWVDISGHLGKHWRDQPINTSQDFAAALLESQLVAVLPGSEFGCEGYLRLSYALERGYLSEAIGRLKTFIGELQ